MHPDAHGTHPMAAVIEPAESQQPRSWHPTSSIRNYPHPPERAPPTLHSKRRDSLAATSVEPVSLSPASENPPQTHSVADVVQP
eukprot:1525854-Prymnesium_polylepis.1